MHMTKLCQTKLEPESKKKIICEWKTLVGVGWEWELTSVLVSINYQKRAPILSTDQKKPEMPNLSNKKGIRDTNIPMRAPSNIDLSQWIRENGHRGTNSLKKKIQRRRAEGCQSSKVRMQCKSFKTKGRKRANVFPKKELKRLMCSSFQKRKGTIHKRRRKYRFLGFCHMKNITSSRLLFGLKKFCSSFIKKQRKSSGFFLSPLVPKWLPNFASPPWSAKEDLARNAVRKIGVILVSYTLIPSNHGSSFSATNPHAEVVPNKGRPINCTWKTLVGLDGILELTSVSVPFPIKKFLSFGLQQ